MSDTCRILPDAVEREPVTALAEHAAHVATCEECAAYAELVAELRREPAPVDEVTRARWLARLSPELDAIAARRTTTRPPWLAIAAVAAVACGVGWWFGRSPSAPPAVAAAIDRALLRPYVVAGSPGETAATALLAGRFSTLETREGALVRASCDREGAQRIALVGPARVAVTAATSETIDLATTGAILVDTRATQALRIRANTIVVRAQQATFAVASYDHATVVFVDRGEVELGMMRLRAGEWFGPPGARSAALVAALRDHEHAIAPPPGRSGILAVDGHAPAITQDGGVLGTAPLWARVAPGDLVVVSTGPTERTIAIAIRDGDTSRVAAAPPAPNPALAALPAPPAPPTPPTRVVTPPAHVVASPPPVAMAPETASQLYLRAEAALRDGDRTAAEATWHQLLDRYPTAPQAMAALYDLANLVPNARPRRRPRLPGSAARRHPRRVTRARDVPRLPARGRGERARSRRAVLHELPTRFPHSPHDAEVLAWLAGRAEALGGCAAARRLATEYLSRYPPARSPPAPPRVEGRRDPRARARRRAGRVPDARRRSGPRCLAPGRRPARCHDVPVPHHAVSRRRRLHADRRCVRSGFLLRR